MQLNLPRSLRVVSSVTDQWNFYCTLSLSQARHWLLQSYHAVQCLISADNKKYGCDRARSIDVIGGGAHPSQDGLVAKVRPLELSQ